MTLDEVPFKDLLSDIVDNRGRTCPVGDVGMPLIATNCINNDMLYPSYATTRYVAPDTYDSWFRGHPKPGDLLFVCKGSPGRVCVTPDPVDFCIAQDMVAIRADPKRVYDRYLFAVLRSKLMQHRISNMHVGTMIPHFKKGDFDKLDVPVPDNATQVSIGDMYFYFSSKIEQNRKTAGVLERLARAVFRAWFVDFEPVHAKAAGAKSFPAMPQTVFDQLPTTFTLGSDSDLGPIPDGWEVKALSDLASQVRITAKPEDIDPKTHYIGLEHMPRRSFALNEWEAVSKVTSNKSKFEAGQILFGKLRPYFHKVGVAPVSGVCSTDIVVLEPNSEWLFGPVLGLVTSDAFVDHTTACSSGTKMPRTNWKDMARYEVAMGPEGMARAFTEIVRPMTDQVISGIHESRKLAELRDYLLPKLLSGAVRVRDAERLSEGVA